MKKSQLKEAIKNEIKSLLSEDLYENMTPEEIEDFKLQQAAHRLKHTGRTLDDERKASEIKKMMDREREDDLNEISSTEANAQLMEIVEHQKQILNILKELKKGDAVFATKGADLNAAIKLITNEVGKTLTKVKNLKQIKSLKEIQESEEMTDTEMNAKAEKEAKEADKKAKKEEKELKEKINKIKSLLKKNKQEVSRIAKLPRNKRTKADDEMFDNMINKTKELKKLEKDLK